MKGALDSSEIEIRQPLQELRAYTSRKCKTTIRVQALAGWDLKFITISVSWPGSMHDARIFRNSSLSRAIGPKFIATDNHLIDDTAYKLLAQVLTPFRNWGQLEEVITVLVIIKNQIIISVFLFDTFSARA
jgi:hypothetical protein